MATTVIYPKELSKEFKKYKGYQLCYVDSIPETYLDYTPESKALMETEEYKKYHEARRAYLDGIKKKQGSYSSRDWEEYDWEHDPYRKFKEELQDYPTEDIINGYTHYFYFTNDMEKQWGDDWDDAPYEYNAETPYDGETDMLQVPVCIDFYKLMKAYEDDEAYEEVLRKYPNYGKADVKLPRDWGGCNSPFCVDDINGGAVAWLYATLRKGYSVWKHIAIHAGENPQIVMEKLEKINNLLTIDLGDGKV